MIIDKITFKNNQCWVVVNGYDGTYLGTWHIVSPEFVEYIRKINPKELYFDTNLMGKKGENKNDAK